LTNRGGGILEEEIIYGKNLNKEDEREREEREEQRKGQGPIDSSANKKTRNVHGNFSFGGTPKGTQQQQFAFDNKRGVGAGRGQPNQAGRRREEYKDLRLEEMVRRSGELSVVNGEFVE